MKINSSVLALVASLMLSAPLLAGDDWEINWWTIDGGGVMASSGGDFELSGSFGQPDATEAGKLTGGPWALTGGFWAVALEQVTGLIFSDRFETNE